MIKLHWNKCTRKIARVSNLIYAKYKRVDDYGQPPQAPLRA